MSGRTGMHIPMRWLAGCWLAACVLSAALAQPGADLPVAELVARNAAARGGTEAWQRLQTMVWTGYVQSAAQPGLKLPFMLEQQRPQKTRFEVMVEGQKSVRIFSDNEGWKLRSSGTAKSELQPYSADELKFAQGAQVILGPLMDFAARDSRITLAGRDSVDGQSAYVLEARTADGEVQRLWLDAQSFLELRLERSFRNSSGTSVRSTVQYRDYRAFEGLQIPVQVETGAANEQGLNRLVIERVALNPTLDASTFAKPAAPMGRRAGSTVVDMRVPPR